MTTSEQTADFTLFAKAISQQEGEDISLDVIYERWWQQRHQNEDLAAISGRWLVTRSKSDFCKL